MDLQAEHGLLDRAAAVICEAARPIVFTGAGISTESGIPDFRSSGGIWSAFRPSDFTYQKFLASEETRIAAWKLSCQLYATIMEAKPNPAHLAIAELERMGKLHGLITQNVDGLHQRAGNATDKVVELHGTVHAVVCLECGKRYPRDEIQRWLAAGVEVPHCEDCRGLLKQATVSFGQPMPQREVAMCERLAREADLFMVVGSSLVVHPAAMMPIRAKRSGATLVIINMTETPLDGHADLLLRGKAGELLPTIVKGVQERLATE